MNDDFHFLSSKAWKNKLKICKKKFKIHYSYNKSVEENGDSQL